MRRKKAKSVRWYLEKIGHDTPDFEDDGLSFFPDWIYRRWGLWRAGRIHDWHYCSRCQPQGSMNQEAREFGDRTLRQHARELLPWCLILAPILLFFGTRAGGGVEAYNSCGPTRGKRCRHNILMPRWMLKLATRELNDA